MTRNVQAAVLAAAGAAFLVFIGALLPWVKVSAPLLGQVSKSGMEDGSDGLYTLLISLVVLAAVAWDFLGNGLRRRTYIVVAVLGAIIAVIAAVDMNDVGSRREALSPESSALVTVSIGEGLYLTLIGGLALVASGLAGATGTSPEC